MMKAAEWNRVESGDQIGKAVGFPVIGNISIIIRGKMVGLRFKKKKIKKKKEKKEKF